VEFIYIYMGDVANTKPCKIKKNATLKSFHPYVMPPHPYVHLDFFM